MEGCSCNTGVLLLGHLLANSLPDIQHWNVSGNVRLVLLLVFILRRLSTDSPNRPISGLTLGVRIFITTYLFHRFPRLRKRLDTYGWFYRNLPVKTTREGSPVLISTGDGLPQPSIAMKTVSATSPACAARSMPAPCRTHPCPVVP